MKPLFSIVVAILVFATNAHSESSAAKELPKSNEPLVEAEESEPQARPERCSACSGSQSLKFQNKASAQFQILPQASEVHTQQFFEECDSEKGCAGVKLKDGKLIQKYGDLEAFKAAAADNSGSEFQFQAAANRVLDGKIPNGGPFWWMNENSPFKNLGADGNGQTQKISKFQSSSFSSSSNNGGAAGLDLAANPFLNGDFSKINSGFSSSGANFAAGQGFEAAGAGFGAGQTNGFGAGQTTGFGAGLNGAFGSGSQNKFASSQSSYSGSQNGFAGQAGIGSQGGNGNGGSQSNFNAFSASSKYGSGYTGSSPAPFSTGANVNLIQNAQKASEYDFEQQQQTQQNIDELFASTGNVQALENSGGELQQTCAGQGYICVLKAQCNNGVVNSNGGNLLHANTQKQYCNTRTEVCCRLETASLSGVGTAQDTLGIGSATFSGSNSQGTQQSGVFSQSGSAQNTFGASSNSFNSLNRGSSGSQYGSNTNQFASAGNGGSQFQSNSFGINKFSGSAAGSGYGTTLAPTTNRIGANNVNNEVFKSTSQSNFIETDSFSAGSQNAGVYRPGAGSSANSGNPYLPPVDSSTSASNVYSTAYASSPRPYTIPRVTPNYVSSTSAPGYLPPVEPLDGSESRPDYVEGGVILDQFLPPSPKPRVPINNEIPAGCAAALKCTPVEFCTADGVISNTTVSLTREQDAYRVPLTDCKDIASGRVGKCCRDPYYTDPWPVNQLGKWVPDVFGGNDGKYVPDSRGSPNNIRPVVTARPPTPPVTGSVFLNNFRTTSKPITPQGPNQVTAGFSSVTPTPGSFIQKTQFNQGSYSQGGRGQFGLGNQGQFGQGSSFSESTSSFTKGQTGQGAFAQAGRGQIGTVGQGVQRNQGSFSLSQGSVQGVRQGVGLEISQGTGQSVSQSSGTGVSQGFGTGIRQGQGFEVLQGNEQAVSQSNSNSVTQGFGSGIRQGQGFGVQRGQGVSVSQGTGFGVSRGTGFGLSQGSGLGVTRGSGLSVSQGSESAVSQGTGFGVSQGTGFGVSQGTGFGVSQGSGVGVTTGQGTGIRQGVGQFTSQGIGFGVREGQGFRQTPGFGVTQGTGFGIGFGQGQGILQGQGQALTEGQGEEITEESVNRVFLTRYDGNGQCGIMKPQKPYGNRQDLEVDFAEIPWQAMVLLQTNKSLLCGGVITRPDVVLTTASCVEGLLAKNVLIKGGEWKLGIDDEPLTFQIVQVKHILRHPFHKSGSLKNDIAALVLTENLRFQDNIGPICLPSSTDRLDAFYNGAGECIVTGWGKIILQAHLQGSIMHGMNVSLINPEQCETKLQQDYPHLLDNYDQDSCVCGQPTNPINNICKVDTGSALACTTDGKYTLRGVYSWESGCQVGNQLAAFMRFDLEWYEWCIGLIESVRFAQFTTTQITRNKIITQVSGSSYTSGVKGSISSGIKGESLTGIKGFGVKGQSGEVKGFQGQGFGIQGSSATASASSRNQFGLEGQSGFKGFGINQSQTGLFNQFGKITGSGSKFNAESSEAAGLNVGNEANGPLSKTFSATFTEKKFFQTEPKFVTYTTKPEIVTFTTKPEYFTFTTKPKIVTYTTKPEIFTYTTKPKIVSYTTKPQFITYETSGSNNSPKYVSPNSSFTEIVGAHEHTAQCKCNGKK